MDLEIKIQCKRCKKEFVMLPAQYHYLKKKSEEMKSELVLPKLCDNCRMIKEQVKSIPMKMQMICNGILEKSKDGNVNKDVMLLFGLARKQMKESLVNYGFIDKEVSKE
jgi:delta-aminolevulinic acid dehydratase/porphobilinogen synthase